MAKNGNSFSLSFFAKNDNLLLDIFPKEKSSRNNLTNLSLVDWYDDTLGHPIYEKYFENIILY